MIGKVGDYSLLQEALAHAKLKDCEICQKHAADYCKTCNNYSPFNKSMVILNQISITSGSQKNVPKRLILELPEEIDQQISEWMGYYQLQERLINRFPFWKHNSKNFAIWFNNVNEYWSIGHLKDIGTAHWVFASTIQTTKWPNEISSNWKWRLQSKENVTSEREVPLRILSEYLKFNF